MASSFFERIFSTAFGTRCCITYGVAVLATLPPAFIYQEYRLLKRIPAGYEVIGLARCLRECAEVTDLNTGLAALTGPLFLYQAATLNAVLNDRE